VILLYQERHQKLISIFRQQDVYLLRVRELFIVEEELLLLLLLLAPAIV
jgi:hypothetical protein